jgi:hypothetical protein
LFSNNIFADAPAVVRERGRFLRIVESMPKNYSIGIVSSGGKPFGAPGLDTAWGAWGESFLRGKQPTSTTDVSWGDSTMFSGPAVPHALLPGARRTPPRDPHDAILGFRSAW